MNYELRLYLDQLTAKSAPLKLKKTHARALYIVEGSLAIKNGASTRLTLSQNSALSIPELFTLSGGSVDTTILRWELVDEADSTNEIQSTKSTLLLAAKIALGDLSQYIIRCDRVDFTPQGEALTHKHQGGGIRCLLFGSIEIHTTGKIHAYQPQGAWFEAGPDPVYATADKVLASAFARVMILPKALIGGKSSIEYVNAEDLNKPKTQRYQIFIDELIQK
jgi:hypothetical protein